MSFIGFPTNPPPIFPALNPLAFPIHKKPTFSAWEHKSVSGAQYQTARQAYPNWEFELQYAEDSWLREQTQNNPIYVPNSPNVELETISQLFLSCYGSYGEFWYSDPEDNSRSGQFIYTGDGSTTVFRVIRTWGFEPFARVEPVGGINIYDPALAVYLDGVSQPYSTFTVTNDLTGTHLNFNSAPALGVTITMDFSYYYRCQWKEDMQQYNQWAYNLWQLRKAEFRSVKP